MSHPTMGAWIEIDYTDNGMITFLSRTPRWVRGLKLRWELLWHEQGYVAPHDGCVD